MKRFKKLRMEMDERNVRGKDIAQALGLKEPAMDTSGVLCSAPHAGVRLADAANPLSGK